MFGTAFGLYAQHTFGHSASVSHPWNLLARQLGLNKCRFVAKASLPTDQGQRLFEIADGTVYVRPLPASDTAKLDWITRGRLPGATVRAALERCRR